MEEVGGERLVAVTMTAERWACIVDALTTGLKGQRFGYGLRFGSTQLRDGLADILTQTSQGTIVDLRASAGEEVGRQ